MAKRIILNDIEREKLRKIYPTSSKEELMRAFPKMKIVSLYALAFRMGLKKERVQARKADLRNLPITLSGRVWSQNELILLRNMLEDQVPKASLCLEFKRPLSEILEEARKYKFDAGYLSFENEKVTIRKQDKKEIILDIDIILKVNSVRMVMGEK